DSSRNPRVGIAMTFPSTTTMTGDITVHTDFSQLEADQPLINLMRFPLFFPEKREFFVESNDLFGFGGLITSTGDDALKARPPSARKRGNHCDTPDTVGSQWSPAGRRCRPRPPSGGRRAEPGAGVVGGGPPGSSN